MSGLNLLDIEKKALKAIDESELRKLIDQAVDDEQFGGLSRLPLSTCGTYVATQLAYFRKALEALREAKSAKNIENKRSYAVRAGSDLWFAVSSMKRRMETEEKEGELFHVDDHVDWPFRFSKMLEVRVSFRWRNTVDDEWTFGRIIFRHEMQPRPVYALARPKRKPSAWKQEEEQQNELSLAWESFIHAALYNVRDFFREVGDGSKIPETFQAVVDPHTRELNNFSLRFWREKT
ncbi:hypothetical protein [Rhizobium laguerreae]|uniref:hypothetical protein n=1 Tax=Rhizobium laguerreae TaxID=1076926 RepID=UPI001C901C16|nr:hypothetical protein [Rhizobium laguerreae]MBY3123481.1 hypothetical protein [Rhizobium laguerreae]